METMTINVDGIELNLPAGTSPDEIRSYVERVRSTQQRSASLEGDYRATRRDRDYRPFGEVGEDVDPATLVENQDWLRATSMVYELEQRRPFEGTDEELRDWGRRYMAYFNYNIFQTGM